MKKLIVAITAILMIGGIAQASWWTNIGGQLPNLSANYIYAGSWHSSCADLESTVFTEKINGSPIDLNVGYVPQTDIGVGGISYNLNNLPASIGYAWRGIFDISVSAGIAYRGIDNSFSWTIGGKLVKIQF